MSFININQTSFDHTFQSKVTFLSNSLFESDAIVSSNAKLQVNGASNFVGASEFADLTAKDISAEKLIITSSTSISGATTFNDIFVNGKLHDGDGDFGTSGQLLSSDGTDLVWIDANTTSVANANNVGVNLNSTNADQFVTFVETNSGNNPIRVDTNLKYNPSTNVLTAPSFSGNLTGTIQTAAQTNITSLGTLSSLTVNGNITQSGTNNYIRINGGLRDKDGGDGSSGQVLSSTGTQVNWINVGDISAGSAAQVAVTDESSDTTCFPLYVTASTGNQSPKSGSNLTFNSSTGQLNATKFVGDGSGLTNINLNYNNLTNKPTIPTNNNQLTNGAGYVTSAGAVPSGVIVLWSGASNAIPSGWVLCNGSNSTPDLRNRFVVGAGSGYAVNATGGSTDATLVSHSHTVNSHTHGAGSYSAQSAGSHNHSYNRYAGTDRVDNDESHQRLNGTTSDTTGNAGAHTHSVSGTSGSSSPGTNSQGSSATNANLPPYYALCYIMKS